MPVPCARFCASETALSPPLSSLGTLFLEEISNWKSLPISSVYAFVLCGIEDVPVVERKNPLFSTFHKTSRLGRNGSSRLAPTVSFSQWYFNVRALFYTFHFSLFRDVEQFCDASVTPPTFDDAGFLKLREAGPNSLLAALVHSRVFDHHLNVGLGTVWNVALRDGPQVRREDHADALHLLQQREPRRGSARVGGDVAAPAAFAESCSLRDSSKWK